MVRRARLRFAARFGSLDGGGVVRGDVRWLAHILAHE
jgi:hypothetical protein